MMMQNRIDMLNEIGFEWSLRANQKRKSVEKSKSKIPTLLIFLTYFCVYWYNTYIQVLFGLWKKKNENEIIDM